MRARLPRQCTWLLAITYNDEHTGALPLQAGTVTFQHTHQTSTRHLDSFPCGPPLHIMVYKQRHIQSSIKPKHSNHSTHASQPSCCCTDCRVDTQPLPLHHCILNSRSPQALRAIAHERTSATHIHTQPLQLQFLNQERAPKASRLQTYHHITSSC